MDRHKIKKGNEHVFETNEMSGVRTTLDWYQQCSLIYSQFQPKLILDLNAFFNKLKAKALLKLLAQNGLLFPINLLTLLISFDSKTRFFDGCSFRCKYCSLDALLF